MNKQEFLNKLEELLAELPVDDKMGAMQYYNEFFDETDPEREQEVLQRLGSPEIVAAEILHASNLESKKQAAEQAEEMPELTLEPDIHKYWEKDDLKNYGKDFAAKEAEKENYDAAQENSRQSENAGQPFNDEKISYTPYNANKKRNKRTLVVLAIVAAALIMKKGFFYLGSVAVGLLIAAVCVLFLPFIIAGAFAISGVAIIVSSFLFPPANFAGMLIMIGGAFVLIGIALLAFIAALYFSKKVLPGIFAWIKRVFGSKQKA